MFPNIECLIADPIGKPCMYAICPWDRDPNITGVARPREASLRCGLHGGPRPPPAPLAPCRQLH